MIQTTFIATIIAGVIGPLALKLLITQGLPYSDLNFWRSIIAIILVLPFVITKKDQFKPMFSKISAARMVLGGTILTLSTYSYSYLSATEVNMLSRLDLPIFILIFGTGAKRKASFLVLILGFVYSIYPIVNGNFLGVGAIWLATGLTAFSYILIRKAATTQSLPALIFPPYIGAAILAVIKSGGVPTVPDNNLYPLLIVTAGSAALLYVLSAVLFKKTRVGLAELTGCIALLVTLFTEGSVTGTTPTGETFVAVGISVVLGIVLIFWEEVVSWLKIKVYPR